MQLGLAILIFGNTAQLRIPTFYMLYAHSSGTGNLDTESWGDTRFRYTRNGAIRRWYGAEATYSLGIAEQANQAIIKFGRNGTSLHSDWAPLDEDGNGLVRRAFYDFVDEQIGALEELGLDYQITNLIWIQGEGDANSLESALSYDEHFQQFVDEIRDRYSEPGLVVKLNQAHIELDRRFTTELRRSQAEFVRKDPRAFLENIDDLALRGDSVHFTAETQQAIGFRFAAVPEPNLLSVCLIVPLLKLFRSRRRICCN